MAWWIHGGGPPYKIKFILITLTERSSLLERWHVGSSDTYNYDKRTTSERKIPPSTTWNNLLFREIAALVASSPPRPTIKAFFQVVPGSGEVSKVGCSSRNVERSATRAIAVPFLSRRI